MENAQEAVKSIYKEYKQKNMELSLRMESFNYEQIARYFLSTIAWY